MLPWLIGGLVAVLALKNKIAPSSPMNANASPGGTTVVPLGAGASSPVPATQPKSQSYFQRDARGNLIAVWGWNGTAWVNLTAGANLNAPSTVVDASVAEARRLLPVTPAMGGFGAPTLYNPSSGIAISAPTGTYVGGGGSPPPSGGSGAGGKLELVA